jgi:sn-glycerol 3-phosphate transport system ATP-binding protein
MAQIDLKNVTKTYDNGRTVIEDLNLRVENGSFTVFVGPSGCGKTTALRMISGLEKVTKGTVFIGCEDVTERAPGDRGIAMVFQNYAIYPHMSVRQNVEFGLENMGIAKAERRKISDEVLTMVDLYDCRDMNPSRLSGGQRQRVALARAISKKPRVFLMDEPLSNLDARLRSHMRTELIELHQKLRSTVVFVTHDQIEAMTMGDCIVVMNEGKIMQQGEPRKIYDDPANVFVARFIGDPGMNVCPLKKDVFFGFRPRRAFFTHPPESERNERCLRLPGRVVTREILGADTLCCVETEPGRVMVKNERDDVAAGENVVLYISEKSLYFFDSGEWRISDPKETARWTECLEDSCGSEIYPDIQMQAV